MDPITGALVVSAGIGAMSSLVQLYNSEKARGAEKERLDQLEEMFDAIKPPDYDLSIQDPPKLHQELMNSPKFTSPAQAPQFNLQALKPKDLQVIGTYNPQVAQQIQEVAPTTIQNTADMQTGRKAQLDALRRYQQIGEGEFDPQYQELVQTAARRAQNEAQSRQQSVISDMQRRGLGGSGVELAANLSGNANAMNSASQANQSAATQAYINRLNALSQGAALGNQISNQEMDLQSRNANIINAFNQRSAAAARDYANNRANTLNDAQLKNLMNAQNISNTNITNQNNADLANQSRMDELTKYLYNINNNRISQMNSDAQLEYQNNLAERSYQNSLADYLAKWQQNERNHANDMKSAVFNNQMEKLRGKAGITNAQIGNIIGTAQDRNNAIQGIANTAQMGAGMYYQNQQMQNNNAAQANNTFYAKNSRWMTPDEMNTYRNASGYNPQGSSPQNSYQAPQSTSKINFDEYY